MAAQTAAVRSGWRPSLVLIAAVSENGVIGRDNALPWRLPSDLRRFRALTMGRPVIMGRKTHRAIGRPLPGRTNIVVTRDRSFSAEGVIAAGTLAAALEAARGEAMRRGVGDIAVIGGADIYAQTIRAADRLEITRVHAHVAGDASFPAIDPAVWRETTRTELSAGAGDDADMTFITYRLAAAGPEQPAL